MPARVRDTTYPLTRDSMEFSTEPPWEVSLRQETMMFSILPVVAHWPQMFLRAVRASSM